MAAYQSLWINLPSKSSKSILLIILRTQHPVTISAGGFYDMTLQSFTSVGIIIINFKYMMLVIS